MSAVPLFDVTVTRSGREEHVLRLGDEPALEEPRAPEAEDYEKRLERAQAAAETRLKARLDEESAELERLAFYIRSNGGDPADELRRVLRDQLTRGATMTPSLAALIDMERERQRERDEPGLSAEERAFRAARHPMNDAHRKQLSRRVEELGSVGYFPFGTVEERIEHLLSIPDLEKRAPFYAGAWLSKDELRGVRQKGMSHGSIGKMGKLAGRSAPLHGSLEGQKGARDERTTPLNQRSGALPRTRPRHPEKVEDEGHEPAAPLHEGVREQGALLPRGAEGIRGSEDAPEHRGPRPRRPRRVKRRRP